MLINPELFLKIGKEIVDQYILDFHETINISENYDGHYFSLFEVMDNINSGYFEIEINNGQLEIFGILLESDLNVVNSLLKAITI